MQISTTVRNARADAFEIAIGTAPLLRSYDGTMPVDCATAVAGTKVAEGALPSDWMATAAAGAKAKSGTWTVTGVAAGLMRYWRLYDTSGTTCHAQGLMSQPWVASTAFVLNQHAHNGGNVYKVTTAGASASSGGPTGTGTGITDGSVVWAYVGLVDMTADNTSIANAQVETVNTFGWTEPNA